MSVNQNYHRRNIYWFWMQTGRELAVNSELSPPASESPAMDTPYKMNVKV